MVLYVCSLLQAEIEKERARVAGWKQQAKWNNNEDPSLHMIDGKPYFRLADPRAVEAVEELRQKESQEVASQEDDFLEEDEDQLEEGELEEDELEDDQLEDDESEEGELQEDDELQEEPPFQDAA